MNILFVGNSFTFFNDMPLLLEQTAEENGKADVKVYMMTRGGRRLIEDLDAGDSVTEQFYDMANARHYDYVFLQDFSDGPVTRREEFLDAVGRMTRIFRGKADNVVLYETWGFPEVCSYYETSDLTPAGLYEALAAGYREAADANGLKVAHVGTRFREICYGAGIPLHAGDHKHPDYNGSVLAMMTFYTGIFGELPEKYGTLNADPAVIEEFRRVISQAPDFD